MELLSSSFFRYYKVYLRRYSDAGLRIIDVDKFEQALSLLEGRLDVHVAGMLHRDYTKGVWDGTINLIQDRVGPQRLGGPA